MLRAECKYIYIVYIIGDVIVVWSTLRSDFMWTSTRSINQLKERDDFRREFLLDILRLRSVLNVSWVFFFWMKFYNFYFSMASIHFSSALDAADENLDSISIWSNWSETWYWLKLTSLFVIAERKFEWVFMTSHKQLLCVVAQRIMTMIVRREEDTKTSTNKKQQE